MRYLITLLLLLLPMSAAGCARDHFSIDPEFRPLEEIRERPAGLGGNDTTITTVGRTCYVIHLDDWLGLFPPGSVDFRSKMLHEQQHALRQQQDGLIDWLAHYETDTTWMWHEESLGWYYELRTLQAGGRPVDAVAVASVLTSYRNMVGKMVDFDTAKAWVEAVLQGRWQPAH